MRTIKIAALNITVHPHSPQTYVNLFKDAYDLDTSIRFRANHYGTLGFIHSIKLDSPLDGIHGEIHRYIDFSTEDPWINRKEHKKANATDLSTIALPEHLRPGFISHRFAFFPKKHRFFFESKTEDGKTFSPKTMQDLINGILNQQVLKEKYGETTVIVEPTKESVERIFNIHSLERLEMEINLPNADDLDKAELDVLDRLRNQHAKREEVTLVAASHASLTPDESTKTLARVAAVNGTAVGKGRDSSNKRVMESTTEHPWEDAVKYNPKTHVPRDVFLSRVSDNLINFMQRFKD